MIAQQHRLKVRYTPPPPPRAVEAPRSWNLSDLRLPLPQGPQVLSAEVHTIRFGEEPWLAQCAPTLDSWCERHGLPLRVWTEWNPDYPAAKFCEVDMLREFLAGDREWLIYVDADVFVHPQAPLPELEPGFHIMPDQPFKGIARWPRWCFERFRVSRRKLKSWTYGNAGVWMCDRDSARRMLDVIAPPFHAGQQEQHHFNWWLFQAANAGMIVWDLDPRWNHFPKMEGPAWFFHLAGVRKDKKLASIRGKRLLPQAVKRGRVVASGDDPFAIVYPWKRGAAAWDELKYSLRSLHQHFQDRDCPIYLLGDEKPDWLMEGGRVRWIHCPRYQDALETGLQLARRVLWMNDDIYFVRNCSPADFETAVHHGDLRSKIDWLDDPNTWKAGMARALVDLHHCGAEEPLNFSTHTPYLYERERAQQTLERFGAWHKMPFETVYFNQHGTKAAPIREFRASRLPAGSEAVVLNHSDRTLTRELAVEIGAAFPSAAPWEKSEAARVKFRVKGRDDGPVYRGQAEVVPCRTCRQ